MWSTGAAVLPTAVQLAQAVTDTIRSVGRGAGASRQSKPIDAVRVAGLGLSGAPLCPGGAIAPSDCIVAGSFFLLREIELAAARVEHVTIAPDQRSVEWLLPTSKTDPRAVGVSRGWDCCCGTPSMDMACPVHALIRQVRRSTSLALHSGIPISDMPLFPTADGEEVFEWQ